MTGIFVNVNIEHRVRESTIPNRITVHYRRKGILVYDTKCRDTYIYIFKIELLIKKKKAEKAILANCFRQTLMTPITPAGKNIETNDNEMNLINQNKRITRLKQLIK